MDVNRLKKNVMWGISTVIGLAVAEGIYRASTRTVDKRELIGDGEVMSDEIINEQDDSDISEDDLPF